MLEFLKTCVGNGYMINTQVSLSQICELKSNLSLELRNFFFTSNVDALITDSSYQPRLVVEFQSQYHDSARAKERDSKKATLLDADQIPLIYSRVKDFGLLCLFDRDNEIILNLFTGEGFDSAQAFIQKYCQ
jgi:hypothetical protein